MIPLSVLGDRINRRAVPTSSSAISLWLDPSLEGQKTRKPDWTQSNPFHKTRIIPTDTEDLSMETKYLGIYIIYGFAFRARILFQLGFSVAIK